MTAWACDHQMVSSMQQALQSTLTKTVEFLTDTNAADPQEDLIGSLEPKNATDANTFNNLGGHNDEICVQSDGESPAVDTDTFNNLGRHDDEIHVIGQ